MNAPQVCCLLGPPERTDALAAVARTITLIMRRHALELKEIAQRLRNEDGRPVSSDRIERAYKRENLLTFDIIAQLAYQFGDCADPIRRLLEPAATAEPTTPEEMIERAQALLLTAQRMLDPGDREAVAA